MVLKGMHVCSQLLISSASNKHTEFQERADSIINLLFFKCCSTGFNDQLLLFSHMALSMPIWSSAPFNQSILVPLLNYNHLIRLTTDTSIRSVDWSNFFITNGVDVCSQLFIDNFFPNNIILHTYQLAKTTFQWRLSQSFC